MKPHKNFQSARRWASKHLSGHASLIVDNTDYLFHGQRTLFGPRSFLYLRCRTEVLPCIPAEK